MSALNATHDPSLRSWLASANEADADFPVQNLPFGAFRTDSVRDARCGVAIGDRVVDVRSVVDLFTGPAQAAEAIVRQLNTAVAKVLKSPDVQTTLANAGSIASPSTPQAMQDMVQNEIARWRSVIARRGIQVE